MPKGHAPKREPKKPKRKKDKKGLVISPVEFTPAEVMVVGKRKRRTEEEA